MGCKAGALASIYPSSKALSPPGKRPGNLAHASLRVGYSRKKPGRSQKSALSSVILAHKSSPSNNAYTNTLTRAVTLCQNFWDSFT